MQIILHITIPKGYRLVLKTLKDGTIELKVEPIGLVTSSSDT